MNIDTHPIPTCGHIWHTRHPVCKDAYERDVNKQHGTIRMAWSGVILCGPMHVCVRIHGFVCESSSTRSEPWVSSSIVGASSLANLDSQRKSLLCQCGATIHLTCSPAATRRHASRAYPGIGSKRRAQRPVVVELWVCLCACWRGCVRVP